MQFKWNYYAQLDQTVTDLCNKCAAPIQLMVVISLVIPTDIILLLLQLSPIFGYADANTSNSWIEHNKNNKMLRYVFTACSNANAHRCVYGNDHFQQVLF